MPTQAGWVFLSKLHFTESRYKDKGCSWLSSVAMLFLETHAISVDSLLVTLLSFTRASSAIDHSSVTILLPISLTSSRSSTYHSSSQFTPLPISFLTAFDNLPFLNEYSPTLNVSFSFPLYNPSTFLASAFFLATNSFSFPFPLFEPFSFPSFLPELSNLFPSLCRAQSFLVTLTINRRISFPSCGRIYPSRLPEQ